MSLRNRKKKDWREVTGAKEARIPTVRPTAPWESERGGEGREQLKKQWLKDFPNLIEDRNINIQAHHMRNSQRPKSRSIIIEVSKEEKILKAFKREANCHIQKTHH